MAKTRTEKTTTVEVFERALRKALATPPESPRKKAKRKKRAR